METFGTCPSKAHFREPPCKISTSLAKTYSILRGRTVKIYIWQEWVTVNSKFLKEPILWLRPLPDAQI